MVISESGLRPYSVEVSNGVYRCPSDTAIENGGKDLGFRPHQFIEAAFASCINITLRKNAAELGIDIGAVHVIVALDRSGASPVVEYSISYAHPLSSDDEERLAATVENCPVCKTLSKAIGFRRRQECVFF